MASTLASLGINAEAGGSALSRFMSDLSVSVETGSDDLQAFADVAGMTVTDFSALFRDDAARAVAAFTDGLGRIQSEGGSAIVTLEEMEITELRMRDTLLRLAGAQGMLAEQLDLGTAAWKANTALAAEADKRYATTEAKMQIARNAVNDFGISLGSTLLPALAGAAGGVADLAEWLGKAPEPVKAAFAVLGTLGATVGLLGGAALIAVPKLAQMRTALETLQVSAATTDRTMKALSMTMKGGFIAAAIVGVAIAVDQLVKALADPAPGVNALTDSLADFAASGKASGELAAIVGQDFERLGRSIEIAERNKWTGLTLGGPQRVEEERRNLEALDQAFAGLVSSGNMDVVGAALAKSGLSAEQAADAFPLYAEALRGASADAKLAEGGIAGVGDAAAGAAPKVQELTEAQKALESALGSFVDPLSVYQDLVEESATAVAEATSSSEDSWSDYADSAKVSLTRLAEELEADNRAHAEWKANLLKVAGTAGPEVAQILAGMGEDGIRLTAQMADGTAEETARMAAALIANAQIGGAGAAQALDAELAVMAAHARSGGKVTADALAASLGLSVPQVQAIAAQLGLTLRTEVDANAERATQSVDRLRAALLALPGSKTVTVRYDEVLGTTVQRGSFAGRAVERAGGGPVYGPGTSTSDSIPALLSDGEFVQQAAAVRKYGLPFMTAVNNLQLPRIDNLRSMMARFSRGGHARLRLPALLPAMAGGGPVDQYAALPIGRGR